MGTVSNGTDELFPLYRLAVADRLLLSATRHGTWLLLIALLTGVAAIGMLVFHDVQAANAEVRRIHRAAMIGTQRVGELQYDAQETRRAILYALTTSDSNLQLDYADQTRAADQRVREGIAQYASQAAGPEEAAVAKRLSEHWASYLVVRDDVLASILEGSIPEAVRRDLSAGVPEFERVRQDLLEVRRLYAQSAERSERKLDESWRSSAMRLGMIVSFVFLFSSAAVWAVQRSQLLGRMHVAKLQMEFVASVSHELRTPLAVIQSAADNLADGIVRREDALVRYGSVLRHQSRAMTELVDQILLFSAMEARNAPMSVESIEAGQIVRATSEYAEILSRETGFRFEYQAEAGLPHVWANLSAVTRIMSNMLTNATKYGGSDRLVTVGASADDAAGEVRFTVTDRGIGMDASELAHIFEPFYRSRRAVAAQIHGTGLGLPVAKRMAESMGGRITVTSHLDQGSTFTLHLDISDDGSVSGAELTTADREEMQ
jgi:signal transduction histidine kinase